VEYWKHLGDVFVTITLPQIIIGLIVVARQKRVEKIVEDGFKETALQAGELRAMHQTFAMLRQDKQEAVALALKVPPPPEEKK
jgi:uncharacterized membrane protein